VATIAYSNRNLSNKNTRNVLMQPYNSRNLLGLAIAEN